MNLKWRKVGVCGDISQKNITKWRALKLFMGEYSHSIDEKGRAIFPLKFRKDIGDEFIITKGLDGCLSAYHLDEWKKIQEQINALGKSKSRKIKRYLFAGATLVSPDKQGRILFPQPLKDHGDFKKDIVFIGVSSSVEIWDKDLWHSINDELTPETVAELMDELDF